MSTFAQTTPRAPSFNEFSGNYFQSSYASTPTSAGEDFSGTTLAQDIIFGSSWTTLFGFSLIIALMLLFGIVYSIVRVRQIRSMEKAFYGSQPLSSVARKVFKVEDATHATSAHALRWRDVVQHVNSENPNDWRQAILEADVLLDDAITKRGYRGEGLGEKMRQVDRSEMNTIDDAWEAHKVRNRLAHEGSNFELTQREARRVVGLYEHVFRELKYID